MMKMLNNEEKTRVSSGSIKGARHLLRLRLKSRLTADANPVGIKKGKEAE